MAEFNDFVTKSADTDLWTHAISLRVGAPAVALHAITEILLPCTNRTWWICILYSRKFLNPEFNIRRFRQSNFLTKSANHWLIFFHKTESTLYLSKRVDDRRLTKINSWRTARRSLLTKFFADEIFLPYSTHRRSKYTKPTKCSRASKGRSHTQSEHGLFSRSKTQTEHSFCD